jgi:hypothetical protein
MNKTRNAFEFDVQEGDYVKFKGIKNKKDLLQEKNEDEIIFNKSVKYSTYMGKIVDISRTGYIGIKLDSNDKRLDYPPGLTIYIERRQILQIYPSKIVEHLSPRLALKHLWKNLIFREVKTTKCSNLLYVEYRYIGKAGFERVKRFRSIEEAYNNISFEYHKNIVPCYEDYFGFTTEKAIRENDDYYDKEIFFSKKCYSELDWSSNPTGDFIINERGFNNENPFTGQLICGIVENGEKGLFFRRWFVCSREFLTLWTMICEPTDFSLTENPNMDLFDPIKNNWNKIEKSKRRVKDFSKLLTELDTSCYSVNLKMELAERKRKYLTHNLERSALYYPNRYKQIAEILFSKGSLSKSENSVSEYSDDFIVNYTSFQKKLVRNLLWAKKIIV